MRRVYDSCDALLILEEGQPFIEKSLRGLASEGKKSMANLQDRWSATENCLPDSVAETVRKVAPGVKELIHREVPGASEIVVSRPPALCPGCGHRDVYGALNDALKEFESPKVFGDIGCYTPRIPQPFNATDSCVDMGASITMAKGAADAGQFPAVSIIGDSTFTHTRNDRSS